MCNKPPGSMPAGFAPAGPAAKAAAPNNRQTAAKAIAKTNAKTNSTAKAQAQANCKTPHSKGHPRAVCCQDLQCLNAASARVQFMLSMPSHAHDTRYTSSPRYSTHTLEAFIRRVAASARQRPSQRRPSRRPGQPASCPQRATASAPPSASPPGSCQRRVAASAGNPNPLPKRAEGSAGYSRYEPNMVR